MAWEHLKKPKIAVLLPHQGTLPSEFVEKVWGPLRFQAVAWCDKLPLICRVPSLPLARNVLAQQALDGGIDYLFWIDSDHVFETPQDPNEALRLLYQCNAPIACGLYRAKQRIGLNYAAWMKAEGGYIPIQSWTGNWIRVDVTGFGCALIKAEVFRAVKPPWFHWEEANAPSEDFYFWERAAKAGYEVRILTDCKLSHIGVLKVKTDGSVTTLDV